MQGQFQLFEKKTAGGKQQFSFWQQYLVSLFSVFSQSFVVLIYMWHSSINPNNTHFQLLCNPPREHLIYHFQMKTPVFGSVSLSLALPCHPPCFLVFYFHIHTHIIYTLIRSPLSLLYSRINCPSCLSLSSYARCSSPFIISVALHWTPQ